MKLDPDQVFDFLVDQGLDPHFAEDEEEILITCTTCDEPKLYVNAGEGMWTCFKCEQHGGLFELLNQMIGLSPTEAFHAIRQLRTQETPRLPLWEISYDERGQERVRPLPTSAVSTVTLPPQMIPFSVGDFNPIGTPYRTYLASRGVGPGVAEDYGMGYCLTGRYHHRIIIPVTHGGALFTFVARSIQNHCGECGPTGGVAPGIPCNHGWRKVLYPSGSSPSRTLFNAERATQRAQDGYLIIVEGIFDALRLREHAVALLGSSLSASQARQAQALRPQKVTVCMDGDKEGRAAAQEAAKRLVSMMPLADICIAALPEGEDPASASWPDLSRALDRAASFCYT